MRKVKKWMLQFHNFAHQSKRWTKNLFGCRTTKIATSNLNWNGITSKKPGTVLLMQNVDLGHTKVIQIRQRETLSHQGAIIYENCCSAAQYRFWTHVVNFLDIEKACFKTHDPCKCGYHIHAYSWTRYIEEQSEIQQCYI